MYCPLNPQLRRIILFTRGLRLHRSDHIFLAPGCGPRRDRNGNVDAEIEATGSAIYTKHKLRSPIYNLPTPAKAVSVVVCNPQE